MSEEIDLIPNTGLYNKELTFTTFCGGEEPMIQLTQGCGGLFVKEGDIPGYIQLTKKDAKKVICILRGWIDE